MAPNDTLEEVRRAADIVETISSVVPLKKAGAYYRAPCPFHKETNPSFTVNPTTQTFYCFGCQEGGDVFSFYMKYHNLSFGEAVRELAARFAVPLSYKGGKRPNESKANEEKQRLYEINELAVSHYHRSLFHDDQGRRARDYLEKRGIGKEIIREFRLGFAQPGWDNLVNVFRRKGVDLSEAVTAGLLVPGKKKSHYDRFRERVIYPIMDPQNRVMGLGGRVLDETLPKYLNSPETPIYHKGRALYGLQTGLKEGRRAGQLLLVEGYMDLLVLNAHGIRNVVASLGTALTREQVWLLKRAGATVVVAFDSDEAGRKAAFRAAPIFFEEDVRATALQFDPGEDPDEYVRRVGREAFLRHLDDAAPIMDFCLNRVLKRDIRSAADKEDILDEIVPLIRSLRGRIQQMEAVAGLSRSLQLDEEIVWKAIQAGSKKTGSESQPVAIQDVSLRTEENTLGFLIRNPKYISGFLEEGLGSHFNSQSIKVLFDSLLNLFEEEGSIEITRLLARHPDTDSKKIIARLVAEQDESEEEHAEEMARDMLRAYRLKKILEQEKKLTVRIQEAEKNDDPELLLSLLREQKELIAQKTQTMQEDTVYGQVKHG